MRIVIRLAILLALLAVADRVALHFADDAVASRIGSAEHLDHKPTVDITGFPFLTQVIGGSYGSVLISEQGFTRGDLTVANLAVDLRGVRIPFSRLIRDDIGAIPVASATATATLTYGALSTVAASRGLTVAYGGSPGSVHIQDASRDLSGIGRAKVSGDAVVVTMTSVRAAGVSLSGVAAQAAGGLLGLTVPLPSLPFGLTLRAVTSGPGGVAVTAAVGAFTIPLSATSAAAAPTGAAAAPTRAAAAPTREDPPGLGRWAW